jgi:pimeloyl-ACP methyl ester carboxylesterase
VASSPLIGFSISASAKPAPGSQSIKELRMSEWYVDKGEGPALVLSHGTLLDKSMYDAQVAELSAAYRVVAYDHRARRDDWQGPYGLGDLGDDCLSLVDKLGIDRFVLGGMSMGGFMAIPLALRIQSRLDGLMLIATMAQRYPLDELKRNERHVNDLLGLDKIPRSFAEWDAQLVFGETTRHENPAVCQKWVDKWTTFAAEAVYWEFNSWLRKEDYQERLREIEIPVLVIHGEEDPVLPIGRAEAMMEYLPNAEFVGIPRAGHTITDEAPEEVTRAMRDFLDRIYGGTGESASIDSAVA